ncbi:ComEA family DNA-binding protein [Congregibacter brevis]|uniref:ComEA family DNA-binding protein n=1 Tax=Congregibacter brevis TaxID=3081201 RepID=A0ABZ0IHH2_9GAMM|nr:ComEA family DNA-binding protein [Congregibacter sp. IMCC45268]
MNHTKTIRSTLSTISDASGQTNLWAINLSRTRGALADAGARTSKQALSRCLSVRHGQRLLAVAVMATQLSLHGASALAQSATPSNADTPPFEMTAETSTDSVNINSASAPELSSQLNGIGGSKAEAIVRYREQFGPFESVEELSEVTGIGAATVERNRKLIRIR